MPASPLVDSTNSLKRSRSAHFTSSGSGPAHKKQCSDDRKARCRHVEENSTDPQAPAHLEKALRRLAKSVDYATVKTLKGMATGREQGLTVMIQSLIGHVKSVVAKRHHGLEGDKKLLQAELYLEWLHEYEFVLTAVENVLEAKIEISTGKTLFSILFHLIDQYISAVDAFQDGWSHQQSKVPVEPCSWVMTLVEEANDSSTDERSTMAVEQAEAELDRYDAVMTQALRRYKAERPEYWRLSTAIGDKQETLARGCCLLSEQTGYGGSDDMGLSLLFTTRDAMLEWKGQRLQKTLAAPFFKKKKRIM
ncbi:hypothetical protein C8F04DRAFT_1070875 [Mycena alexandri]|uniref:Uncharacterized protein n=1 Tax=Mycena alexandri TaxID=1745969 RepID=A0AAD6TES3_9AGAR|nr:hypothetical protein C8F04DRAFT_1070875 [Mycena alexandri]